mmetsp:Transcript_13439/g.44268  ORF Transcript_13439/g.44268 Transcript_13439/m.44268 type:complete len:460 (+) Transcript_13439:1888-3267(+)
MREAPLDEARLEPLHRRVEVAEDERFVRLVFVAHARELGEEVLELALRHHGSLAGWNDGGARVSLRREVASFDHLVAHGALELLRLGSLVRLWRAQARSAVPVVARRLDRIVENLLAQRANRPFSRARLCILRSRRSRGAGRRRGARVELSRLDVLVRRGAAGAAAGTAAAAAAAARRATNFLRLEILLRERAPRAHPAQRQEHRHDLEDFSIDFGDAARADQLVLSLRLGLEVLVNLVLLRNQRHLDVHLRLWWQLEQVRPTNLLLLRVAHHHSLEQVEEIAEGGAVGDAVMLKRSLQKGVEVCLGIERRNLQKDGETVEVIDRRAHGGACARPPPERMKVEASLGLADVGGLDVVSLVKKHAMPRDGTERVQRIGDALLQSSDAAFRLTLLKVSPERLVGGDDDVVLREPLRVANALAAVIFVNLERSLQLRFDLAHPLTHQADGANYERRLGLDEG